MMLAWALGAVALILYLWALRYVMTGSPNIP